MKNTPLYHLVGYLNLSLQKKNGFFTPVFEKEGEHYSQEVTDNNENTEFLKISKYLIDKIKTESRIIKKNLSYHADNEAIYIFIYSKEILINNKPRIIKDIVKNYNKIRIDLFSIEKYNLYNFLGFSGLASKERQVIKKNNKISLIDNTIKLKDNEEIKTQLFKQYMFVLLKLTENIIKSEDKPLSRFLECKNSEVKLGNFLMNKSLFKELLISEDSLNYLVDDRSSMERFILLIKYSKNKFSQELVDKIENKGILENPNYILKSREFAKHLLICDDNDINEKEIIYKMAGHKIKGEEGCPVVLNFKFENNLFHTAPGTCDETPFDDIKNELMKKLL